MNGEKKCDDEGARERRASLRSSHVRGTRMTDMIVRYASCANTTRRDANGKNACPADAAGARRAYASVASSVIVALRSREIGQPAFALAAIS